MGGLLLLPPGLSTLQSPGGGVELAKWRGHMAAPDVQLLYMHSSSKTTSHATLSPSHLGQSLPAASCQPPSSLWEGDCDLSFVWWQAIALSTKSPTQLSSCLKSQGHG
ncbi:uncharacterized [Tachysurus ichikawai]